MGFIGICIDFIAWPLIALVYPMFASIRAIETSSKYHMRKLVIYWTLFSLISLSEFAFARIIEWIPFWSSIKLTAIFWLVMPRFEGACDAYERFISPFLCVDLRAVIDRFDSPTEENKLRKMETFPDIAEQFIKENGLEALEKLIASKDDSEEPDNYQREIHVLEPDEKGAATKVQKENDAAVGVSKMTATEPTATTRPPEIPPLRKEWMCDLCKVKMTSEKTLNEHLHGNKHKSKCESLKASKLPATAKSIQDNVEEAKGKVGQGSQQESAKKKQDAVSTQQFKLWCDICQVKLLSGIDLVSHLKGKRHSANIHRKDKL